MRKACLYLLFTLLGLGLKAQPFSFKETRSPFTYIYKLTGQEARKLFFSDMDKGDLTYLHTLVDSFPLASDPPSLPNGNYLLAYVEKNNWKLELLPVGDLSIFTFAKRHGALIILKEKNGDPITKAMVKFGARPVKYNPRLGGYEYRGRNQRVKMSILHNNVYHFATLFDGYEDDYYDLTFIEKLGKSRFIKSISSPFVKLVRNWNNNNSRKIISYPGFLTYNKPLYRKGDTLYWKAFATSLKLQPIDKPLELRLIRNIYPVMDSLIGLVAPYRPGMFMGSFRLSDSLIYDQRYNLQLRDPLSKAVYIRSSFTLEDYTLSRMNFKVNLHETELNPWKNGTLKLTLEDENELPIADGKLSVTIVLDRRSVETKQDGFFIKDTLWRLERDADPDGTTEIMLPDSIFPKANYKFFVNSIVRTVSGEYRTATNNGTYNNDSTWISFEPGNDSILVTQWKANKIDSAEATLIYYNNDYDTLISYQGRLPLRIPLNTAAETLEAETEDVYEEWESDWTYNSINCVGNRTKDSVWIQVNHPLGIPFWYTIYRNKKILETGSSKKILWRAAANEKDLYLIDLHYIIAGESHKNTYNIPFAENELKLFAEHPTKIEPGQQVPFTLKVRDAHDNPVQGADVTAYGFTKKFSNSKLPTFRNYGRIYKVRKQKTNYTREEDLDRSGSLPFDPKNWMSKLGLDTIQYFRFIFPDSFVRVLQPTADSITQMASFLLERGNFKEVIQLDIDQQPVYMAGANTDKTYSFRVSPGYHSIRFRTFNASVEIDSVEVIKGRKNSFSFNYLGGWNNMKTSAMPDSFTIQELELWRQRLIHIKYNPQEELTYFKQKDQLLASSQITREDYSLSGLRSEYYGPINSDTMFIHKEGNDRAFAPMQGYTFYITDDSIKSIKQPLPVNYRLRSLNSQFFSNPPLGHRVLTEKILREHWENLMEKRALQIASNIYERSYSNSSLSLRINENYTLSQKNQGVKLYLLTKTNEPDFLRIKASGEKIFSDLEAGSYRLLVLYGNNNYIYRDSIAVRKNGISIYNLRAKDLREPDSFITSLRSKIMRGLIDRNYNRSNTVNYDQAKQMINTKLSVPDNYRFAVGGRVVSGLDGTPIPFCAIVIKGTNVGTVTDANGYFQLNCPEIAVLTFSSVGFESTEKSVTGSANLQISLPASVNRLQEVVVTAYGVSSTKKDLTGSVAKVESNEMQMLMGKAPGVNITVRGISNIEGQNLPKIYVNGMLFDGTINDIDTTQIEHVSIIKANEAKALFGTDGLEDVIDIRLRSDLTSIVKNPLSTSGKENSIRRNFKDDAYWLPNLITDEQGQVHFNIHFPDDITSWRNQFVAVTEKGQFGAKETFINAQKSLSAALLIPDFLVEGDQVKILGRAQYYGKDSLQVHRSLRIGSRETEATGFIKTVLFDSSVIKANNTDSITALYEIQNGNAAYDGERRSIPVFQKGVAEDSGLFIAMRSDTSFQFTINKEKGALQIRADKSLLPVLMDEIDQLDHYEYLCNEQMASKIIALLLKEKVYKIQQTPFKDERKIRNMVRKLQNAANTQGLWGWWSNSTFSPWISKHVIDALVMARESGYGKEINYTKLSAVIRYELELRTGSDRLWFLEMLQKISTKKIEDSLLRMPDTEKLSLQEKIRWTALQLNNGQRPDLTYLWTYRQLSTKGNPYWSVSGGTVWNNDVLLSAAVYGLLKQAGGYEKELQALRYYFLEQRKTGSWKNTYESATVLWHILPDLLKDAAEGTGRIYINDKEITQFPYQTSLTEENSVNLRYTGKQPVYFTAYQRSWNANPGEVSGTFTVRSQFSENGKTTHTLSKGNPVVLKVDVDVKGQTDFVMIEIPIPAGTVVQEKKTVFNEVYREYYKNKVLIYFEKLPKGRFDFTISLLPKFTGTFSLNPARALEMYYPTNFGREQIKQVQIKESAGPMQ